MLSSAYNNPYTAVTSRQSKDSNNVQNTATAKMLQDICICKYFVFTYPINKNKFRQSGVGILDATVGIHDLSTAQLINQLLQTTV